MRLRCSAPVIAEGPAVGGGACGQDVRIQCQGTGALIDEVVACIADQPDAVREEASDKLRRDDDDGVEGERDPQSGAEFMVGVGNHRSQCPKRDRRGQDVVTVLLREQEDALR